MRIHMPEICSERDAVKIRSLVERPGYREHLWYSVPHGYEDYLVTERLDAFVVGLLLLGMKNGEDIYVDGVMSEKLFYNLTQCYMHIVRILVPALHRIKVVPEQLDSTALGAKGVATGFTGGVDSFCALADHHWGPVPDGFKVTHLLIHNVGSHGHGEAGRRVFEERFSRTLPAARELGMPIIKIDSNLDDLFCTSGLGFQLTNVARGVSAVLTLQKLIGRYLLASSFRYADCRVHKTYDMAYADPMALHLLSTESTECISTGSQYSRVEKIARISDVPITYRYLDVCVSPGKAEQAGNCSKCWKCNRTMLTLEMLGKLDRYSSVFDLNVYRKNRVRFMGQVLVSRDVLMKEVAESARQRHWRFPPGSWFYALLFPLTDMVRRAVSASVLCLWRALPEPAKNAVRATLRRSRGCSSLD